MIFFLSMRRELNPKVCTSISESPCINTNSFSSSFYVRVNNYTIVKHSITKEKIAIVKANSSHYSDGKNFMFNNVIADNVCV